MRQERILLSGAWCRADSQRNSVSLPGTSGVSAPARPSGGRQARHPLSSRRHCSVAEFWGGGSDVAKRMVLAQDTWARRCVPPARLLRGLGAVRRALQPDARIHRARPSPAGKAARTGTRATRRGFAPPPRDEPRRVTGQGRPRSPKTVQSAEGEQGKEKRERIIVVVRSPCQEHDPADAHPSALKSVLESANPRMDSDCAYIVDTPGQRHGRQPIPEVVKQDKSSGGSVDTTKTRSGPQSVRMCKG